MISAPDFATMLIRSLELKLPEVAPAAVRETLLCPEDKLEADTVSSFLQAFNSKVLTTIKTKVNFLMVKCFSN